MIKDTELRRFNFVSISETAKIGLEEESEIVNIWEIDQIKENEISIYNRIENIYETLHVEDIFPIEINEDWFIKSKFIKKGLYYTKKYLGFEILVIIMHGKVFIEICSSGTKNQLPCQYEFVHEFQNIFFFLTGEELVFSNNA